MMKQILTLLFLFVCLNSFAWNSKVYVPKGDVYVTYDIDMSNRSLNSLAEELGFRSSTFYSWSSKDYKTIVLFKFLSKDIICIMTETDFGEKLSKQQVDKILLDNNYDYHDAYSTYSVESDLEEGIEGQYLTIPLMEDVTHAKVINNKLTDTLNGYVYTFKNGYVISYTGIDGLTGFAKEYKGTALFNSIKLMAQRYHRDEQGVLDEINMQFDYLSKIGTTYLSLGKSDKYNYNFALLYVDLYCPNITMSDFITIVHNNAEVLKVTSGNTTLKYNYNYYVFNSDKILIEVR